MIKYHPEARFLTDYAAGSLPVSQALCVASHLHYCVNCRAKIRELTELGAELFMQQPMAAVETADSEYARLMARINDAPAQTIESTPANEERSSSSTLLPRAVNKLAKGDLERLRWRRVGRNFRYSNLNVGDKSRETSLLHIKAGGSVPTHRHSADEITVILKGSFSDREDNYEAGDFIVRTKGETHQPVAAQDQDCLCLATLDAPIVMENWLLRIGMFFFNRSQAWSARG